MTVLSEWAAPPGPSFMGRGAMSIMLVSFLLLIYPWINVYSGLPYAHFTKLLLELICPRVATVTAKLMPYFTAREKRIDLKLQKAKQLVTKQKKAKLMLKVTFYCENDIQSNNGAK